MGTPGEQGWYFDHRGRSRRLSGEVVVIKKHLSVDINKCTGCRMCELACAMVREKVFNPKKARIRVYLIGIPAVPIPVYTRKCDACGGDPTCVKYCEVGALIYSEENPKQDKKKILLAEELALEWLRNAENSMPSGDPDESEG